MHQGGVQPTTKCSESLSAFAQRTENNYVPSDLLEHCSFALAPTRGWRAIDRQHDSYPGEFSVPRVVSDSGASSCSRRALSYRVVTRRCTTGTQVMYHNP